VVSGQWSPFGELEAQRVIKNTPTPAHISFTDLLSKAAIKKGSKSEIITISSSGGLTLFK
jgi:hypothetical protein